MSKEETLEKGLKGALAGMALALAPGTISNTTPKQQTEIPNYGPQELKTNLGPEHRPEVTSKLGPEYKDNQVNYPSAPKEKKMVFDPKTLHPDLIPIAHLESSFGKNMKHGAHSKGVYHTAIGALGFKPSTAHEEYLRSKHLQKLFPGHTEQNQFMDEIKDNPSFYNALAAQHWGNIKKRLGGSMERATFAWRWGQGAAERADDATIQNDGYVKNYKRLAEKLSAPETAIQKSEIQGLEKMAIKDIQPGIQTDTHVDYTHVLPKEHQEAGYKLKVHKNNWSELDGDKDNEYQAVLTHKDKQVGYLNGTHHSKKKTKDFEFNHSEVDGKHTNKGLGTSMYEAMMAHAQQKLGSKNIIGSTHSTSASKVHRKVSKKHGMDYKRELNYGPKSDDYKDLETWTSTKSGPFDNKYKSYKYTIKSELDKSEDIYNYDHLLSHERLNEGYSIRTIEHGKDIGQEHVLLHNGKTVGELVTKFHDNQDLARLSREHRGKGLGKALLEVANKHNQLNKSEKDWTEELEKKVLDPSLGYSFSHEHHDLGDGDMLTHIKAHHPNGEVAGEVMFEHHSDGMLKPADVTVHPNHRRLGLASSMYSHAQKLTGKSIKPSTAQTEFGQALWQGNAKNPQFGTPKMPELPKSPQPTMKYDKFDKSAKEWVEKQTSKTIEFIHYSHLPILKELDPTFQGTGLVKGQERERPNRPPRAYVYLGVKEPESSVTTLSLYKYEGKLSPNDKIYNIRKDPLGLLNPELEKTENGVFYVPPNLDKVERQLIQLGYSGYTNYVKQYPEATALFVKVPLKRV